MLLAVGPCEGQQLAAKALLATLAKLLATAHAQRVALRVGLLVSRSSPCSPTLPALRPGHACLTCVKHLMRKGASACAHRLHWTRQDALMDSVPLLLWPKPLTPTAGRILPAALLPHAVAHLLPLLLLPPERVRALDAAQAQRVNDSDDRALDILAASIVRSQPSR